MSERGIFGTIPGCACTYEEGDSDCAVHPTCNECGEEYRGKLVDRVGQLERALRTACNLAAAYIEIVISDLDDDEETRDALGQINVIREQFGVGPAPVARRRKREGR